MAKWLVWIVIAVLFYEVGAWRTHRAENSTTELSKAAPQKPAAALAKAEPPLKLKPSNPQTLNLASAAPVPLPLPAVPPSLPAEKKKDKGYAVYLPVEDQTMELIQQHWPRLGAEAYTTTNDKGWRIHFLSQDNVFKELGLQDGDFIPRDQYEVVASDPRVTEINKKLLEAFRRIERN